MFKRIYDYIDLRVISCEIKNKEIFDREIDYLNKKITDLTLKNEEHYSHLERKYNSLSKEVRVLKMDDEFKHKTINVYLLNGDVISGKVIIITDSNIILEEPCTRKVIEVKSINVKEIKNK